MFKRAIPPCTPIQQERQDRARSCGCIACVIECLPQPNASEIHHQTKYGRQIGQDHSVCLCQWHHRGICVIGKTSREMAFEFGPSLAKQPRKFFDIYGANAEQLEFQNRLIGWELTADPVPASKIVPRLVA